MKGLEEAAEFIRSKDNFHLICHYDADGLSAGGIAYTLLKRLGKKFDFKVVKGLDPSSMDEIMSDEGVFLFVDLGSSSLEVLEEKLEGREVCIIDHHKPSKETSFVHFNPHLSGFDGAVELSGSGATYLVAKKINEENKDLSGIALVGAVGDMQDKNGALVGLNRKILEDAVGEKIIKYSKDIRLYGRFTRPLPQFLAYSFEPAFPGLTANESACYQFLEHLGIEPKRNGKWVYYYELNADEKRKLISGLYVYGRQVGVPDSFLNSLVGEVYELINEKEVQLRDIKEFSTLLNACGRNGEGEIGVMVCAGDREEYLKKALALLEQHRRNLREAILYVQEEKGVKEKKNIYVLDTDKIKDTIIGTVAGMLYGAKVIKQNKPIIALSRDDEGMVKISGRGTNYLVRKGLDLGKAMKQVASEFEGAGGGHDVAAGARIKPEYKEQFVEKIDEVIGEQLL